MKPEFAFREFVASALMLLFAYTLVRNPHDQTIIGALLTGFAGAWGFYLGGSKVGSDTAAKNADTVAAQAAQATDTAAGVQDVQVVNDPQQPVPTKDQK
jgi:hypothetical protein